MQINKSATKLYASPEAVINQYLYLPGQNRVGNIIDRVTRMDEISVDKSLANVLKNFELRHRDIKAVFLRNFDKVQQQFQGDISSFSHSRKQLLGAFFTKEYSIQAAALFNPSIVSHPDQQGLQAGEQRFVLSLRATGEGHISSVVFKTGIVDREMNLQLDNGPGYFTRLKKDEAASYSLNFVKERVKFFAEFKNEMLEILPDHFTQAAALGLIQNKWGDDASATASIQQLAQLFDSNYDLTFNSIGPISETVIFPNSKAECMGMEDVRFVHFIDGEKDCYYGTYTAYDGRQINTHLIETNNFVDFKIRTLYGAAIADKGMALFPEKVNGKYVIISRQGGEKISIMFSDDIYCWQNFELLMEPVEEWEMVQLGNCGSPIKTDKGWLLLTHGVGTMRTYVISAILLDLANPSNIIGRLKVPLIQADEKEREGYVPNVVYTCGLLRHADQLLIPYAVSDSATGFMSVGLNELLNELTNENLK